MQLNSRPVRRIEYILFFSLPPNLTAQWGNFAMTRDFNAFLNFKQGYNIM